MKFNSTISYEDCLEKCKNCEVKKQKDYDCNRCSVSDLIIDALERENKNDIETNEHFIG